MPAVKEFMCHIIYTLKIVERWIYTAGFVLVVINAGFFYFVPVTPEPTWLPQYDSR